MNIHSRLLYTTSIKRPQRMPKLGVLIENKQYPIKLSYIFSVFFILILVVSLLIQSWWVIGIQGKESEKFHAQIDKYQYEIRILQDKLADKEGDLVRSVQEFEAYQVQVEQRLEAMQTKIEITLAAIKGD